MTADYDRSGLIATIREDFALEWVGPHGVNHWSRVLYHGLKVGQMRKSDLLVVELFAFLHDSCREDNWTDPEHGLRAADYAYGLNGIFFKLNSKQLDKLCRALRDHSHGRVSTDKTIQTCWDADRLDLGRVGIYPSPKFMSHEAGEFIESAYRWSLGIT